MNDVTGLHSIPTTCMVVDVIPVHSHPVWYVESNVYYDVVFTRSIKRIWPMPRRNSRRRITSY